jgi:hypothetical protein
LQTAAPGNFLSMPSILLEATWSERIKLWGYRVGVYTAITLLDDPAWLALMFC